MKKTLLYIIVFSLLLIFIKFRLSNYTIEYKVDNYSAKTIYKNRRFYYELSKDNKIFNFDIYKNRGFNYTKIDKVEEIIDGDLYCVIPKIKDTKTYPLCYVGKEYIDYSIIDNELLSEYKSNNVEDDKSTKDFIYDGNLRKDEYIALWNYKGYIIMNGSSYQIKELFKNDKYDNSLAYIIGDTIYMANNDEEHEYSSLITLNIETQKATKIDLGYNIDFDSYFVGNIKNSLYIFDNKYSILYEVNIKNKKVNIIGNNEKGFIKYENGKFVTCSKNDYKIKKIKYNQNIFNYEYRFDEKMYKIYNENKFVRQVIFNEEINVLFENDNSIYYLYKDSVYRYNPMNGSSRIFYNYELSFNSDNTTFVYIK